MRFDATRNYVEEIRNLIEEKNEQEIISML